MLTEEQVPCFVLFFIVCLFFKLERLFMYIYSFFSCKFDKFSYKFYGGFIVNFQAC